MKQRMKKRQSMLVIVLTFLICVLTSCGSYDTVNYYDLNVQDATSEFYVNDFAGVFSQEQKAQLMANAISMDEEYAGIQVVVTTVETLDSVVEGYTIEEIAYSMYRQYGIGKDDMGILILISTGDREVRIETGYQMQSFITDAVSGQLLDNYGIPYFANDEFAEGLISLQSAVIAEIRERVPKNWQDFIVTTSPDTEMPQEDEQEQVTSANKSEEQADEQKVTTEKSDKNSLILVLLLGAIGGWGCSAVKRSSEREKLQEENEIQLNNIEQAVQTRIAEMEEAHKLQISSLSEKHRQELKEVSGELKKLTDDARKFKGKATIVATELELLKEKYARVQQLHPEFDFDKEIQEMIEAERKQEAEIIDGNLASAYGTPADKDNINIFVSARKLFDETPVEIRQYMASDRDLLEELYTTSVEMQREFERLQKERQDKCTASKACEKIREICARVQRGDLNTYEQLDYGMRVFKSLTPEQKAFFEDKRLIDNLREMHRTAEADVKDYNAAKSAEQQVKSIMDNCYSPDEDDLNNLHKAMKYYHSLTEEQSRYFSESVLNELKSMLRRAQEDHEEQERRRQAMRNASYRSVSHSSNSSGFRASSTNRSSSSSRSFSGRGGRPSGGGASRKF